MAHKTDDIPRVNRLHRNDQGYEQDEEHDLDDGAIKAFDEDKHYTEVQRNEQHSDRSVVQVQNSLIMAGNPVE